MEGDHDREFERGRGKASSSRSACVRASASGLKSLVEQCAIAEFRRNTRTSPHFVRVSGAQRLQYGHSFGVHGPGRPENHQKEGRGGLHRQRKTAASSGMIRPLVPRLPSETGPAMAKTRTLQIDVIDVYVRRTEEYRPGIAKMREVSGRAATPMWHGRRV